ncbi:beta-propeller fold lactonase family protein [Methylacidiphilum caldifontis]|uniref:beta-propeller fold lactonase family protein n=1 Tax=Methylacidiphilum caldifontis TaxID=2795386 RepID=UPI001A90695F|nr:beta-propeller fold lactonase family protein [Methylacidiphilum caldifontis]QSR88858.1 beta-propeller fold lactonase family protein [Methylacidiphilum caldifontis]
MQFRLVIKIYKKLGLFPASFFFRSIWSVSFFLFFLVFSLFSYGQDSSLGFVSHEGGITLIDIAKNLKLKEIVLPGSFLRGIGLSAEGKTLFVADKSSGSVLVVDIDEGKIINTIALGQNPEFLRIHPLKKTLFVSYEPDKNQSGSSNRAKIAQIDIHKEKILKEFLSGEETEAIEFSADGTKLLVSNEGENTIGIYDISSGKEIKRQSVQAIGLRPRGLKRAPFGDIYAVTFENSNKVALFDKDFSLIKEAPTASGPYGLAFDPSAKKLLVLAFRDRKLQVFEVPTLKLIAEAPVGERSWHFTFSPDGKKILVASGRSNKLIVLDAVNFKELATIEGIKAPWGIVTFPPSYGSLDNP